MVLLHLLHDLAKARGWHLEVAHFNHELRGAESDGDERLVERTAGRMRLPFHAARADVRAHAKANGVSLEMAARELRHRFLAETAVAQGCGIIALAHHLDDQIELFFLRLLRGAGIAGIAGMDWRNPSPADKSVILARPLLDRPRAEILDYARAKRILFREDASNSSLDIPRNRIRRQLIPLLEEWQPNVRQSVWRLMQIAGEEEAVLGGLAVDWVNGQKTGAFEDLSPAVQRRILELELVQAGLPVSFDLVETLRLNAETKVSTVSGRMVARTKQGLLELDLPAEAGFDTASIIVPLEAAEGCATFSGVEIDWRRMPESPEVLIDRRESGLERFDSGLLGDKVVLRHWRAGDRYQPSGMKYAKKLQDLFIDLKVPRAERRQRLVGATLDGRLFWVEGLRISQQFKVTSKTRATLEWRWCRGKTSIAA